jgi:threonine/homoserine/homoserine lactone efflux protein
VGPAISDVLPLALGVAISPIPIIAVILMLFSTRARTNGPSFLVGWVLGLALVCAIVSVIAGTLDVGTDSGASDGTSTLKVALGLVLIIAGVRRWRHRPAPGAEEPMPKWMAAVDTVTPVKAVGLGVLLSGVNPKNLLLAVAAAATVAQANLSTSDTVITLAAFVVLSSLTIAVPVVFYLLGGDRAKTTLEGWKVWLAANNATVMALLFLVFGVVVFAEGTGRLSA